MTKTAFADTARTTAGKGQVHYLMPKRRPYSHRLIALRARLQTTEAAAIEALIGHNVRSLKQATDEAITGVAPLFRGHSFSFLSSICRNARRNVLIGG